MQTAETKLPVKNGLFSSPEMRLYHFLLLPIAAVVLLGFTVSCAPTQEALPAEQITIEVEADGSQIRVTLPAGGTVDQVLELADLSLEGKDRVEPRGSTELIEDTRVQVIRVEEIFETTEEVIPYQVIRQPTETLPTGQEQLLQAGKNGLKEVVFVRVLENGEEVAYREVNSVVVEEAVDEMVLVGVRSASSPIGIPGRLAYISNGNAWMMEGSTANRTLLTSTGDLDGRVFSLSPDGNWLLFSRSDEDEEIINTLWVVKADPQNQILIDLKVQNVIHFADWVPDDEQSVAFSTVEPRMSAPGWQANNDLVVRKFSESGWSVVSYEVLEPGYVGVYGWWGTEFRYSPEGEYVAYASPDQVGIIDVETGDMQPYIKMPPFRTTGDWAWMSGLGVGPLGNTIYAVDHVPPEGQEGTLAAEESQQFDLIAISKPTGVFQRILTDVGMFAYPLPSPMFAKPSGEASFEVAYLQAVFPEQSATSNYRVSIVDRDGSNPRVIFPPPDQAGMQPQRGWGAWAPEPIQDRIKVPLAVLYEGNIWILDLETGESWQVTGDGRVQRLDW